MFTKQGGRDSTGRIVVRGEAVVNEELKHLDIEQIDRLVRARSEDETDVTGAE